MDHSLANEPGGAMVAYRGAILHFRDDPRHADDSAVAYFDDGLLVVQTGRVVACGEYRETLARMPGGIEVHDHRGHLIVPGFVDTHIHFAQTDIIASYGKNVLDWLERHTFPAERRFSDNGHAAEVAEFAVDEMLRNGTTSSMVFATVHKGATEAVFRAAESRGVSMIAGKVLMDRNCPEGLCEAVEKGTAESRELILKWHKKPGTRLRYAVTPRFAPTSSERQLAEAGRLLEEFPDVHLQTHLAENTEECRWVRELFPWSRSYLDVYDRFGLVGPNSVFAHCIHLDAQDRAAMAANGCAISFCPTSNLFLGSGLFDADAAQAAGLPVGIGTDVGGGTSFSVIRTLHEAHKVLQLRGQHLDAMRGFYLATLGGARALGLDGEVGNFETGKYADFVLLDKSSTPLIARRMQQAASLDELLFAAMMLGEEHMVAATFAQGRCVYRQCE